MEDEYTRANRALCEAEAAEAPAREAYDALADRYGTPEHAAAFEVWWARYEAWHVAYTRLTALPAPTEEVTS